MLIEYASHHIRHMQKALTQMNVKLQHVISDLTGNTALKVISETGIDMTRWPTAKHFASWLGLCPNNKITGGKVQSSRSKPSASGRVRTGSSG